MGVEKTPLQQFGPDEQSQYQLSEIARLKAEVGGLRAQMAWREIESAPKNMQDILVWNGSLNLVYWDTDLKCFCLPELSGEAPELFPHPTHWLPLPRRPRDPLSIEARHNDEWVGMTEREQAEGDGE